MRQFGILYSKHDIFSSPTSLNIEFVLKMKIQHWAAGNLQNNCGTLRKHFTKPLLQETAPPSRCSWSSLVVGGSGVAVVQGGPAVPRAAYARVAHVAASTGVVAMVDEDGLALVFLEHTFHFNSF